VNSNSAGVGEKSMQVAREAEASSQNIERSSGRELRITSSKLQKKTSTVWLWSSVIRFETYAKSTEFKSIVLKNTSVAPM
jgi:hypothetical protein